MAGTSRHIDVRFAAVGGLIAVALFVVAAAVLFSIAAAGGRRLDNRDDPDRGARRPYAVYLVAVVFVSLFTALYAAAGTVGSVLAIFVEHDRTVALVDAPRESVSISGVPFEVARSRLLVEHGDEDDERIGDAIRTGLLALGAGAALVFHRRRVIDLAGQDEFEGSAGWRVVIVYAYVACFLALLTVVGAGLVAANGAFQALAPGIASPGATGPVRDQGIVQFVAAGLLCIASLYVLRRHWTWAGRLHPRP